MAEQPTATPTITVAAPSASVSVSPTTSASGSASSSSPPTSSASASASASADAGRPANQCADDDLGVTIIPSSDGGGAGSEYYQILFTNGGGTACALRGTPGVSVVGDGNGTQLGQPAARTQTGVKTISIGAGESVAAPLKVVNIGTNGGPLSGCTVRKGDGYRVYAPHSTKAIFAEDSTAVACAPGPVFMTVGPVAAR